MDAVTGEHDVDETTVPRSRLRAAWDAPAVTAPAVPKVTAAPAAPAVHRVVRDTPEPARPALRRTAPTLEGRIAPWAVPPADAPPPSRPAAGTARGWGRDPEPATPVAPRHRQRAHAAYAPTEGAVDLNPEQPTPLTDPPRRSVWRKLAGR